MMPVLSQPLPQVPVSSAGGRLVASDGRELPLKSTTLRSRARAGLARTVVEQHFVNPHSEPLTVIYKLPLPADGAVSGFCFDVAGERIVGVIETRQAARERYEEALIEGRSAALLEEDRSSLFSQEVGNIPAGGDVRIELVVDHPLLWLPEGSWQWRFPTVVAPRYLGDAGSVADADRLELDVATGHLGATVRLELEVADALCAGGIVSSTSHALALRRADAAASLLVSFADDAGAALDRDVVVAWPVAAPSVGVAVDVARPSAAHPRSSSAFALLTVVPPQIESEPVARDLIVLLDTSGSMSGEPLDQAKRVVGALIAGLGSRDQLELIEFSTRPRRFRPHALSATPEHKREALAWLQALSASGGTEMHSGIAAALAPLRAGAQRQVLLVTDGLIGAEERVVAEVLERLPRGCRVHTLGIGAGVNRSLTGPVARAGRGSEQIAELGADVEPVVARVLAHLERPVVVELELTGAALRSLGGERLPDLMAGSPALLAIEVDPEGGELELRGHTASGVWSQRLVVPPTAAGDGNAAVPALFARERVLDLEMRVAAKASRAELERDIERLGLDFAISTRLTSWVAVSRESSVDPTQPTRRVTQPQALPHGMSVAGLGLRAARPPMPVMASPMMAYAAAPAPAGRAFAPRRASKDAGVLSRIKGIFRSDAAQGSAPPEPPRMAQAKEPELPGNERSPFDYFGAPPSRPTRLVLSGRVLFHRRGLLVVEAALDVDLKWSLPERVELELDDGTRVTVETVKERSTASGELRVGQSLRLVLVALAPIGHVRAIELDALCIDLSEPTR